MSIEAKQLLLTSQRSREDATRGSTNTLYWLTVRTQYWIHIQSIHIQIIIDNQQ